MSQLVSRSGSLRQYRELVLSLGGNPEDFLSRSGLSSSCLDDEDILVPSQSLAQVLEITAEELAYPGFGLELAKLQSLEMLGPVGLLIQQSDTLGEALVGIQRYLHVHSQAGVVDMQVNEDRAFISFEPLVSYEGKNRQLIDLSIAVGYGILKGFLKDAFSLRSLYFSYEEPESLSAYYQHFSCPLVFSSEVSGAMFSSEFLNRPISSDQHRLKSFVNDYIEKLDVSSRMSIDNRVRILIKQFLPLGNCNIEQISLVLGINKRTLQRRLKEMGSPFQKLLNQERHQIAIRYLKESNINLSHLSDLLGYSEVAAFSRSFKTWTGKSPRDFIKQETKRLKHRS